MGTSPSEAGTDESTRDRLLEQIQAHDVALRRAMTRWTGPMDLPSDLTLRQLQVLTYIRYTPAVTGHALADLLGVTTPTVSGLVDRLVGKDLLLRDPDPEDRRRTLLSLTPAAATMLDRLQDSGDALRTSLLSQMSLPDLAELARLFAVIADLARTIEPDPPA